MADACVGVDVANSRRSPPFLLSTFIQFTITMLKFCQNMFVPLFEENYEKSNRVGGLAYDGALSNGTNQPASQKEYQERWGRR